MIRVPSTKFRRYERKIKVCKSSNTLAHLASGGICLSQILVFLFKDIRLRHVHFDFLVSQAVAEVTLLHACFLDLRILGENFSILAHRELPLFFK